MLDSDQAREEALAKPWRTGGSWGYTIVAEGEGPADERGRRPGDVLVGMALTRAFADQVVADHNASLEAT